MVGGVGGSEMDVKEGDVAVEVAVVSVEEDIGMGCCEIGAGGGSEGVEIWLLGE